MTPALAGILGQTQCPLAPVSRTCKLQMTVTGSLSYHKPSGVCTRVPAPPRLTANGTVNVNPELAPQFCSLNFTFLRPGWESLAGPAATDPSLPVEGPRLGVEQPGRFPGTEGSRLGGPVSVTGGSESRL